MISPVSTHVTPRQAGAELAKRELARRRLGDFCEYVDPRFLRPAHVDLLIEKLERVAEYIESGGERGIGRLMILMPPRHGKTELASIKFPGWLLGRVPDSRILLTSYGADLASKNSRSMRDLVMSDEYHAVFGLKSSAEDPVMLSADSRSVSSWDLAQPHRGGVSAAGVGGALTGLGADLLVVDDPLKNREEADNENRRELVDEWYRSSAYTRLSPRGAVVIFHTRWHPDDLAGRLISKMAENERTDQFEIVYLPAVSDAECYADDETEQRNGMLDGVFRTLEDQIGRGEGEPLWPERFDGEWMGERRHNAGDYEFSALFQQTPYMKSGQRYLRDWFRTLPKLPDKVKIVYIVRYWDKSNSPSGDYTAGVLMAYCSDGNFYILDVNRKQGRSHDRDERMKNAAESDRKLYGKVHIWHQQDPGSAGKDSAEATNRVLTGFIAKFEPVTGDKETRSGPLESAFQGGMVFLIKGAWNDEFIKECVAFPRGKYDDQVDAGSSAYNKLLEMIGNHRESRIL